MGRAPVIVDTLSVTLPVPPMGLSKNSRVHWTTRHRLFQEHKLIAKNKIDEQMDFTEWRWAGRVWVEIVWYSRGRAPDADNCIARVAAAIDGAQAAGLYRDDVQIAGYSVERLSGPPRVVLTFHHERSEDA